MKDKIELIIINTIVIISFIIICLIGSYYLTKPKEEKQEITQEITDTVQSKMEEYYTKIFEKHSGNYCGEINYSDVFEVYYINTKTFNSIEEMKNSYKTFLSEKYIDENIINKFKEKNNKLYCFKQQNSSLEYEKNSFKITNITKTEKEINVEGTYETEANNLNLQEKFNMKATLINENNNWVIDKYQDVYNKES
jgi:hypothetical protein